MTETATATSPETTFEQHAWRGRFNAAFFRLMEPYMEWNLHNRKQRLFTGLLARSSRSDRASAPISATWAPAAPSWPSNRTGICTAR